MKIFLHKTKGTMMELIREDVNSVTLSNVETLRRQKIEHCKFELLYKFHCTKIR